MKIAVICASGRSGKLIAGEAVSRGHEVTAIVRDKSKLTSKNVKVIEKDIFDLTQADLKGFDAVVDAFGAWTEDTLPLHSTSLKKLCDILSGTKIRLLVVGGAGSLFVDPGQKVKVMDSEGFPDAYKPLALNMGKALDELRNRDDVLWTYLSPAGDFRADGARTGSYKLGGEQLTLSDKGESVISYADYAIAMVDEAENGKYIKKRFSVVQK